MDLPKVRLSWKSLRNPVLALTIVLASTWWLFWLPIARQSHTTEVLAQLASDAEEQRQTLGEFLDAIQGRGIQARGEIRSRKSSDSDIVTENANPKMESKSNVESTAYIVVKEIVNVLGMGADWHIEMSLDSDKRIQRADVKIRPVGFP